jgi:hypothetical protein
MQLNAANLDIYLSQKGTYAPVRRKARDCRSVLSIPPEVINVVGAHGADQSKQ